MPIRTTSDVAEMSLDLVRAAVWDIVDRLAHEDHDGVIRRQFQDRRRKARASSSASFSIVAAIP
jgi:hypothetical protein